jgi:hypothetical protein
MGESPRVQRSQFSDRNCSSGINPLRRRKGTFNCFDEGPAGDCRTLGSAHYQKVCWGYQKVCCPGPAERSLPGE